MNELVKQILLQAELTGLTPTADMSPNNPLIETYEYMKKNGLIILTPTAEGGIAAYRLTQKGRRHRRII